MIRRPPRSTLFPYTTLFRSHFESRGLIFERRRRGVNRVVSITHDGAELIDGFPKNIHHAAKGWPANGDFDPFTEIVGLHTADHALDRLHRDGPDAAFAEVLLDFRCDVEWLRYRVAFARNANGVIDRRKVPRLELNVHDRSNDLNDVPHACVFLCHLPLL